MAPLARPRVVAAVALLAAVAATLAAPASAAPAAAVLDLDDDSLPKFLDGQLGGVAVVAFTAEWCGHCKALHPKLAKAAESLRGVVPVANVDADKNRRAGSDHGVGGFPTIKLFYRDPSTGKVRSQEYKGPREAKDIAAFALDKASSLVFKRLGERRGAASGGGGAGPSGGGGGGPGTCGGGGGGPAGGGGGGGGGGAGSCGGGGGGGGGGSGGGGAGGGFFAGSQVVPLTEANFDDDVRHGPDVWFVLFFAPWCGHCVRAKPELIEAATQLAGRVRVGAVDCTQEQALCARFSVQGYPSFKAFAPGGVVEDYGGEREAAAMVEFAAARHAEHGPAPEVRELTDAAVLESACLGGGGEEGSSGGGPRQLCFVAFLPDVLDTGAAGRRAYVDALKALAKEFKGRPWGYLWAAAGSQPALEKALSGGAGVVPPLLVALKPADAKYSTMRGAFDAADARAFVESLRRGREPVAPVLLGEGGEGAAAGLPPIASVEPWDGQDGEVEAEEEEFSLEDIMAA